MLWRRQIEDDRARWPLLASFTYAFLCRRAGLIWYAGAVVFGVAVCAYTGIDTNYDRLNYHIASARSLLQWRVFDDVAISGIQTYFNPTINVLSYGLARGLGFFWSRYALVAIHALAWAFMGAAVARRVDRPDLGHWRWIEADDPSGLPGLWNCFLCDAGDAHAAGKGGCRIRGIWRGGGGGDAADGGAMGA
jgi:hypothetical protein